MSQVWEGSCWTWHGVGRWLAESQTLLPPIRHYCKDSFASLIHNYKSHMNVLQMPAACLKHLKRNLELKCMDRKKLIVVFYLFCWWQPQEELNSVSSRSRDRLSPPEVLMELWGVTNDSVNQYLYWCVTEVLLHPATAITLPGPPETVEPQHTHTCTATTSHLDERGYVNKIYSLLYKSRASITPEE